MEDHGLSVNKSCPCAQKFCPILGNCVLCIQNHLEHKRHLPECIQNMLRPTVQFMAAQMELKVDEGRPSDAYWQSIDRDEFVRKSSARHGG
jgi:hypothetical protein